MTAPRLSNTTKGNLLVFDGDCAFCTTWVERLRNILPEYPETIPWQWADLDALGLSRADVEAYAWYVTPSHQYAGHLAFSAMLRSQHSVGLRFLGHLIATPPYSWLAALTYRFIAANRHRLPGGTPACRMAPPA